MTKKNRNIVEFKNFFKRETSKNETFFDEKDLPNDT